MKKSNRGLLASLVSICSVGGISGAPIALAQDDTLEEVTVTASRLRQSGYEAPTPVTTLDSDDMEVRGTTNIADIINELPGFTGSLTPTSTTVNSRQNGANALDLRGLGPNRNLVLVNGRRHVPFDEFGNVNINAIPSLAIDRLEVVTGGASAAWGSDAVSGVINVIYNKKLEGAKVNVQYGQSAEGDGEETRVALAFGTNFANDRGHLLLAMDYTDNKGIPESRDRGWQQRHTGLLANSANTGPNDGIPQFLIADNAALYIGSPNGVTIGLGLPTDNLEFLPNGTAIPRDVGIVGGNLMIGGSGAFLPDRSTTLIPQERQSF
ncbi:MAG: Plug domain-containing protein, partial [Chromatocurvus sp.]